MDDKKLVSTELIGIFDSQVVANVIGLSGVVHHDEEDGLFAQRL